MRCRRDSGKSYSKKWKVEWCVLFPNIVFDKPKQMVESIFLHPRVGMAISSSPSVKSYTKKRYSLLCALCANSAFIHTFRLWRLSRSSIKVISFRRFTIFNIQVGTEMQAWPQLACKPSLQADQVWCQPATFCQPVHYVGTGLYGQRWENPFNCFKIVPLDKEWLRLCVLHEFTSCVRILK